MMSFLLFLIVFMITYNNGTARPRTASDFSIVASNGVDEINGDNMQYMKRYKMPTMIEMGTQIDMNGTLSLDPTINMFRVALIENDGYTTCNITLDLNSGEFRVTPAIKDYSHTDYSLNLDDGETEAKFLLRLIARANIQHKPILGVHIQVNEEGESDQLICDIDYKNIAYIEMQQGETRVNGLFFYFDQNR